MLAVDDAEVGVAGGPGDGGSDMRDLRGERRVARR